MRRVLPISTRSDPLLPYTTLFRSLLWLLNATTEEQKQGISNYFSVVGAVKGTSGSSGVFGGVSATDPGPDLPSPPSRSEEHTSELQSLMRTSYSVFCLKNNNVYIQPHKSSTP